MHLIILKNDTDLITFSDDMDGLRKVPIIFPIQKFWKNLETSYKHSRSFGKYKSFGEHNNEMLKMFLKNLNLI